MILKGSSFLGLRSSFCIPSKLKCAERLQNKKTFMNEVMVIFWNCTYSVMTLIQKTVCAMLQNCIYVLFDN